MGNAYPDYAALVETTRAPGRPVATIGLASGSFDLVKITNEINVSADGIKTRASEFSLQLNTNTFTSPLCSTSSNASCQGWEQFVLGNDPGSPPGVLFIQFWLLDFDGPCPSTFQPAGVDCVFTTLPTAVPVLMLRDLRYVAMTARAESNGTDTVILSGDGPNVMAQNADSQLTLAPNWTTAEFNIFGDQTYHLALFSAGSTLVPSIRIEIAQGLGRVVPTLVHLTGETNSLNLIMPACLQTDPVTEVTFEESNVAGASYSCPTPTPPNHLCADAQELVAYDNEALASAQAALKTKACSDQALFLCTKNAEALQAALSAAEAEEKKACP